MTLERRLKIEEGVQPSRAAVLPELDPFSPEDQSVLGLGSREKLYMLPLPCPRAQPEGIVKGGVGAHKILMPAAAGRGLGAHKIWLRLKFPFLFLQRNAHSSV